MVFQNPTPEYVKFVNESSAKLKSICCVRNDFGDSHPNTQSYTLSETSIHAIHQSATNAARIAMLSTNEIIAITRV